MTRIERILVVDDERGPRESMRMILKDKYQVITVDQAKKALEEINKHNIDLAILDIKMPEMDGIELLAAIKKIDPGVEVLMVTGYANVDTAVNAMRHGAFDYLSKPFDKDELEALVKKGLDRHNRQTMLGDKLNEYHTSMIRSLLATIDAKDSYTSAHSQKVAEVSVAIAKKMNRSPKEIENLRQMALVHDIGKIGVSEDILRKRGPLSEKEFEIIKKHPEIGAQILKPIDPTETLIPAVYYHHEKYEGGGYPEGLVGEEIPLAARILAVADAYSAMITDRPYREKLGQEEILEEFEKSSGKQFDPAVVKAIIEVIREGILDEDKKMEEKSETEANPPCAG